MLEVLLGAEKVCFSRSSYHHHVVSIVCWQCVETINRRHMVAFLCTFEMFDAVLSFNTF